MSNTDNTPSPAEPKTTEPAAPVAKDGGTVPENVPYGKFRELLDEKKKLTSAFAEVKTQLDTLLSEKEEAERKRLSEINDFKTLYEKTAKDKEKLLELYESEKRGKLRDRKYNAFLREVGGLRKDEYRSFVDLDAIPTKDDGDVDLEKVREFALKFKEQFPELITEPTKAPPPSTAPRSGQTFDKPKTTAELLAAYAEVRKIQQ
jgi:hypothetical protein